MFFTNFRKRYFLLTITSLLILNFNPVVSESEPQGSNIGTEDDDFDDSVCVFDRKHPFYQNHQTGTMCCRGRLLPRIPIVTPETTGECAISTKTTADGVLSSAPLWCAYSCQLKKLGLMDSDGNIVPETFFNHLAKRYSAKTKENVKLIMTNHLKCFTSFKNTKFPCYTPLGFHKCWKDALEYLCTNGMPKDNDFSTVPAPKKTEYVDFSPDCLDKDTGKYTMPSCCHSRPLPWLIPEIVRSSIDVTKMQTCIQTFQKVTNNTSECGATCALVSLGVVDDSMDLDVQIFEKEIFKHFPSVKPSAWMTYLGPTFLFYDEYMTDQTQGLQETLSDAQRVCGFHHAILTLHLNKIEEYCEMTTNELKEAFNRRRK